MTAQRPSWVTTLGPYSRALWEWDPSRPRAWYLATGDEIAQAVDEEMNGPWDWEIEEPEDQHSRRVQAEIYHYLPKLVAETQSQVVRDLLESDNWTARPGLEQLKVVADRLAIERPLIEQWTPTAFLPAELQVIQRYLQLDDPYQLT